MNTPYLPTTMCQCSFLSFSMCHTNLRNMTSDQPPNLEIHVYKSASETHTCQCDCFSHGCHRFQKWPQIFKGIFLDYTQNSSDYFWLWNNFHMPYRTRGLLNHSKRYKIFSWNSNTILYFSVNCTLLNFMENVNHMLTFFNHGKLSWLRGKTTSQIFWECDLSMHYHMKSDQAQLTIVKKFKHFIGNLR